MSFENINFKNEPDLKFKEIVCEHSDVLSSSYPFDCYIDKNGIHILISPYYNFENIKGDPNNFHIFLINLKNYVVLRKLKGHKERIVTLRYFQDLNTKNDYLISADIKYNIIIWDLTHNYKIIFEKKLKYNGFIYSLLMVFESNKKYIITSSIGSKNITKIIDINDKNKIIEIKESELLPIYHLIYWYNHIRKQHNIIQCGNEKILITEFPKIQTYDTIITTESYPFNMSGIVYTNKGREFLAISSSYGLILIYDLKEKVIMLKIKLEDSHLLSLIKWNDNNLLILDTINKKILIFDITDNAFKDKNAIISPEFYLNKFCLKIVHPIYGESLLSLGDFKIGLFINNNNK